MLIHERVKADLKICMKEKRPYLGELRYILGEFTRIKGSKDGKAVVGDILTDEQAIRVLNTIIVNENKILEYKPDNSRVLIDIAGGYLPKQLTDEELKVVLSSYDFSQFKNKMQVVGLVKKEYGTKVDAKRLKELVEDLY